MREELVISRNGFGETRLTTGEVKDLPESEGRLRQSLKEASLDSAQRANKTNVCKTNAVNSSICLDSAHRSGLVLLETRGT